tara:strand:- start:3572 stop:5377 length:1806 start_codon:yes stop_codon:yes gene_type:complete
MSSVNYNIQDYSLDELMNIFNITALTKESIEQNINDYIKSTSTQEEKKFVEEAKEKLINARINSSKINHDIDNILKTKIQPEVPDDLNPTYRNIVTRIINIDSKFRANAPPLANELLVNYNVPINQTTKKPCTFNPINSTNYVALFTDQLNDVLSIQLINYSIPYIWYNIDANYFNNFFKLGNILVEDKISINSGNYNLYDNNNIYNAINSKLKKKNDSIITFNYDIITGKTKIQIYDKISNTSNFYYRFVWFDKTNLNVKSNNTLGYKLGFRQFETRFNEKNIKKTKNKYINIYLRLLPLAYSPLLDNFILMKPITLLEEELPYLDCSGEIYYTYNDIDLYKTTSNSFNITYKKDIIYSLSSDISLAKYFNLIDNIDDNIDDYSPNQRLWTTDSEQHLTPELLYTTYTDLSFEITPYVYSTYLSEANANLTLTKYLLLGIDDYQNNRINSGLVSIESVESYIDIKKINTTQLKVNNCQFSDDINYSKQYTNKYDKLQTTTNATLKTINAIEKSKNTIQYSSKSPTVDVFAVIKIPLDNTLKWGQLITDDNIVQANYTRRYFGPVTLNSFKITLYTEDGFIINLNDNNWNFSILCKQLYKY